MTKRYPFKFLDSYGKTDTDIFFGRDPEIEALYEMTFQSDILLVYGASGTGKTSLINCGLASRFQAHDWLALSIRRGNDLNAALQQKLEEAASGSESEAADLDLSWLDEDEDSTEEPSSALSQQLQAIYRQYFRPIYLIFDQFEELYVLGSKAEQAEFIRHVQEIQSVEHPVKMIFVIREEYLGHLFEFERSVPQLLRKKLRVEPMNLDKVGQVVRGAAQLNLSNIRLQAGQETAIIEGIFQKIKGKEQTLAIQLPYLQVFLDKLYLHITGDESRQADALFTTQALLEIGDIGDVLRNFLEEQAIRIQKTLAGRHADLPEDTVWQILSPLATLEGTKEPMLETTLIKRLPTLPPAVVSEGLRLLEQQRILRFDENEGRYEVAHDSLAARIAEHRNDDEIAILEIRRLVSSQMALKADAREFFSEKQLNLIDPYLDKLGLEAEARQLIEESRKWVEATARKRRRRNLIIGSVLALAALVSTYLGVQAELQSRKVDKLLVEAIDAQKATAEALEESKRQEGIALEEKKKAEQATKDAITQREKADSLSGEAQKARDQAQSALTGLRQTTAQIVDNLLLAADEDILQLDYAAALEKLQNAVGLKGNDQKVGQALMEMTFFYGETYQFEKAASAVSMTSALFKKAALKWSFSSSLDTVSQLESLRNILSELDASHFEKIRAKYYPDMVTVKGGAFCMGRDPKDISPCDTSKNLLVELDDFQIARTETTLWQFNLYCLARGKDIGNFFEKSWGFAGHDPAIYTSWYDAVEYANWVNHQFNQNGGITRNEKDGFVLDLSAPGYRLPTDAEWEYAARGGVKQDTFRYSGSDDEEEVAHYNGNSSRTQPVRQKKANALGLFDMSGNVWEWCWDWSSELSPGAKKNPKGSSEGSVRVIRGGGWNRGASNAEVSYRYDYYPFLRSSHLGFRLVCSL